MTRVKVNLNLTKPEKCVNIKTLTELLIKIFSIMKTNFFRKLFLNLLGILFIILLIGAIGWSLYALIQIRGLEVMTIKDGFWAGGYLLFLTLMSIFIFRIGRDEVSPKEDNYFFSLLGLFLAIGVVHYYVTFIEAGIPWYVIFAPLIGASVLVLLGGASWAIWKKVRKKSKK